MQNDTIAAISTAPGIGAISIVRMSGENALKILDSFFQSGHIGAFESHTIRYGKIFDERQLIDEVLVSYFQAPKTFTKEDIVEINTHGGVYIAERVLSLCLMHGARLAENGEFTERAFLNGRIDLTEAESVLELIESRSELSLKLATQGLEGKIRDLTQSLRDDLLNIIALIEVNIDYPEFDDVQELTHGSLIPQTEKVIGRIEKIVNQAVYGQLIKEGINTAIVGRPNVGKSSLLNALINEDKAIVTDIQGTTRDTVEGRIVIGGITLNLIDTAGIRETEDTIEKMGIDKSVAAIENARLILLVIDQSEPLQDGDKKLLSMTESKERIVILNKDDLPKKAYLNLPDAIPISSLLKQNLEELEARIHAMYLDGYLADSQTVYLSNARHIGKYHEALNHLKQALETAKKAYPVDMIEMDLKEAWLRLGEMLGDVSDTALIDTLFSQFCLGK